MTRTDLKGMTLPELEEFLARWGKERYRARQLFRWIYQKHADDFAAMTDLSKELRGILAASCRISGFPAERVETSADGTEKYLFRLEDGEAVESVLIPDEGRRTLCISSQVGCPLLCGFCATGAAGFRRNMTSAEIVQQACFAAKRLAERGERLSNVVFMGMGEPLLNVPEVSRTIGILLSQFGFGISGKRVTVSTAGIVPEMLPLALRYPVSFAVSINAARGDLRSLLMPINRKYPLRELVAEMKRIPLQSGRKVTAEYVLLAGVNDSPEDALALSTVVPWRADQGQPHSLQPARSVAVPGAGGGSGGSVPGRSHRGRGPDDHPGAAGRRHPGRLRAAAHRGGRVRRSRRRRGGAVR